MPSLETIKKDKRSTWDKLYAALLCLDKSEITDEELDVVIRLTPNLVFLPGTGFNRIKQKLADNFDNVTITKDNWIKIG